ncbi:MAG: bifunctional 5,10-methylenetetrahydrofolate dehydrogenase/5,10-methenyltetrahydrofolate cyclohydrolase [Patescibacteria group bacterium]
MVIDGRAIARNIVAGLAKRRRPSGKLAAILVGDHSASEKFLKEKARVAEALKIPFQIYRISGSASQSALKRLIKKLNTDQTVRGIVLQLPLPGNFSTEEIIPAINVKKDIDALRDDARVPSPAVGVVKTILEHVHFSATGKRAVVVGRGLLVGKPIAAWLTRRVARIDQFHRSHFDQKRLREADLVVSGVGTPMLIHGADLKKGVVLIDFGYGMRRGKVSGDFDFQTCTPKARAITPTPGGTGPILVAELFRNFFAINKRS